MINFFRHGDVNLHPVGKIEGEVVKHNGSYVLAYGEVTGHKHLLTAERMEIRKTLNGRFYLHLETEGKLTHEEHKTLTIPVGDYEVIQEREYDHFARAVRKVID